MRYHLGLGARHGFLGNTASDVFGQMEDAVMHDKEALIHPQADKENDTVGEVIPTSDSYAEEGSSTDEDENNLWNEEENKGDEDEGSDIGDEDMEEMYFV
jgi:hypothetical protein